MSVESNRAALERARDRWNAGDLDGYLRIYSPNVALHGYPGVEPGLDSVRSFYRAFFAAFPSSRLVFEDVFGEGDRLACRFVVKGKHGGTFQGISASGKEIALPGITILRFRDGLCIERFSQADFLGLLTQLGASPAG